MHEMFDTCVCHLDVVVLLVGASVAHRGRTHNRPQRRSQPCWHKRPTAPTHATRRARASASGGRAMLPQIGGHRRSRGARFDLQDAEDLGSEEKGPAGRRPLLPVISNKKAFGAATARDRADSPKARDFFALAHRARNPHESDFHMQARLGFTRTRQSSIRLRPLATGRSSNVQSGDEYAGAGCVSRAGYFPGLSGRRRWPWSARSQLETRPNACAQCSHFHTRSRPSGRHRVREEADARGPELMRTSSAGSVKCKRMVCYFGPFC